MNINDLPSSVREIAEVIGPEAALRLINQLPAIHAGAPGKKSARPLLYVPTISRLKPDHRIVKAIGWDLAYALSKRFGGEIINPANCLGVFIAIRNRYVEDLLRLGCKKQVVADLLGISERQVSNIANAKRATLSGESERGAQSDV